MRRRRKSGGGGFSKGDHVHAKFGTKYFPGIITKVNNDNDDAPDTYDIILIDGEEMEKAEEENIRSLLLKNDINDPRVILDNNDNAIPSHIAKNHKNNENTTPKDASIAYSEERKRLLENMKNKAYEAYKNLEAYSKAESKAESEMPSLKSHTIYRAAKTARENMREELESKLNDSIDGIYRHLKLGQRVRNNEDEDNEDEEYLDIGLVLQVNDNINRRLSDENYRKVIMNHIRYSKALERKANKTAMAPPPGDPFGGDTNLNVAGEDMARDTASSLAFDRTSLASERTSGLNPYAASESTSVPNLYAHKINTEAEAEAEAEAHKYAHKINTEAEAEAAGAAGDADYTHKYGDSRENNNRYTTPTRPKGPNTAFPRSNFLLTEN